MQQSADPADSQRADELQRRFEMAVDDVRQLKRRNAQLEEELADLQATAMAKQVKASADEPVTYDWETTKKRLLAELDADASASTGKQLSEDDRLSVEGTIRITDEMIEQRDHEIAQLKQMLSDQSAQTAAADAQAAAHSAADMAAIDQDEVIHQERERLAVLEKEWHEKMRQAEVEISVQRAKSCPRAFRSGREAARIGCRKNGERRSAARTGAGCQHAQKARSALARPSGSERKRYRLKPSEGQRPGGEC